MRDCTKNDLLWLLGMTVRFNQVYYDVPIDVDRAWQYLSDIIEYPNGVAIRTEKSAIVGVLAPDPFRDWKALVEFGWYSEGKDGLRLLDAFEKRGKQLGANEVRMTTLEVNPGVAKVLSRRGYTAMETSHRLKL